LFCALSNLKKATPSVGGSPFLCSLPLSKGIIRYSTNSHKNATVSSTGRKSNRGSATLALLLAMLLGLSSFFGLAATIRPLLLRSIMGVRLFVVVPALAAEEEQNLLRVFTHGVSHFGVGIAATVNTITSSNSSAIVCTGYSETSFGLKPNSSSESCSALAAARIDGDAFRLISIKMPVPIQFAVLGPIGDQFAGTRISFMKLTANNVGSESPRYPQNRTSTFCPGNEDNRCISAALVSFVKSAERGEISTRRFWRLIRIWLERSSTSFPFQRSKNKPPTMAAPTIRTIQVLMLRQWSARTTRNFKNGLLGDSGKNEGISGQNTSIPTSIRMPIRRIVFPQSLRFFAAANATSRSWFTSVDSTVEDYERSDRLANRIGDIALIIAMVALIVALVIGVVLRVFGR